MPCKDAIVANPVTGRPDQTVEEIMDVLEKNRIRTVPIVDSENKLLGLFGFDQILKGLLPVAATMEDGLQRLDFVVGAAPGIAKRLRKMKPKPVSDYMKTDCHVVYPDTPTWEAVRLLTKYGSPIPVVDRVSGKMVGIISEQSAIVDLKRILIDLEENEEFTDDQE